MSPVSLRVVGKDNNMYKTSTVPILNRSPKSLYSVPASLTSVQMPIANYSLYSSSSAGTGRDFNKFIPTTSVYNPSYSAFLSSEIPTRDYTRPFTSTGGYHSRPTYFSQNYAQKPLDNNLHLNYLPPNFSQNKEYTVDSVPMSDTDIGSVITKHVNFKEPTSLRSDFVTKTSDNNYYTTTNPVIPSVSIPSTYSRDKPDTCEMGINTSLIQSNKNNDTQENKRIEGKPDVDLAGDERETYSIGINTSEIKPLTNEIAINTTDIEKKCQSDELVVVDETQDKPTQQCVPPIEITPRSQQGSDLVRMLY